MPGNRPGARPFRALLASAVVLAGALVLADAEPSRPSGSPRNVIVLVTDDQRADTWSTPPSGMPWLASRLADPASGWTSFTNAVVSTPMCCPSRATILTGLPSWRTGVTDNLTGDRFDASRTLAVWLHDRGYRTAMIGKYLNGYPWDRGPVIPPGWDRWFAKTNDSEATTYTGYGLVDQGVPRRSALHITDVLAAEASSFLAGAPLDRPWFLYLSTPAGHAPWTPSPGDAGTLGPPAPRDPVVFAPPGDAPAWLRTLPAVSPERAAELDRAMLAQRETLLGVDRTLESLWRTLETRGETDDTVIIVTSDNGYSFGEGGWVGKQVPFESSVRVPLAIYAPGAVGGTVETVVSNLDIAPTIAAIAGITPPWPFLGADLLGPLDEGRSVPMRWDGSPDVPAWRAVRTTDTMTIEWSTGETQTYPIDGGRRERQG